MNERSVTIAEALEWTQEVFAEQVRQLLASKYLCILDLDRVLHAMRDFRVAMDLPEHLGRESVHYAGLRALHCVNFERIDAGVRRGIPVAIIQTLGLTDHEAARMLGVDRWSQLKADLLAWAEPPATVDGALQPDEPNLVEEHAPVIAVTRHRKWPWAVGAALAIAVIAMVMISRTNATVPASEPSYLRRSDTPLLPLQPLGLASARSQMEECADQGGSCVTMESAQPATVLRQLAAAVPAAKGTRYRIELSVVPIEEPGTEP